MHADAPGRPLKPYERDNMRSARRGAERLLTEQARRLGVEPDDILAASWRERFAEWISELPTAEVGRLSCRPVAY